ncbi:MAG: DUF1549 domain-containing protein [Planctomycetales bacterium]|nr:DUF1549 domain-containing protein [Planctomycetales bacterium]
MRLCSFVMVAFLASGLLPWLAAPEAQATDGGTLPPIFERFAAGDPERGPTVNEVPNFQKHISPLMGRLGCNGRACHGSFQGQGGFTLSLFGYDFDADYKALMEEDSSRLDTRDVTASLILAKPIDADVHEGGQRFQEGGWEYWVVRKWIEAGAPYESRQIEKLSRLEVLPNELQFTDSKQTQQLQVIAHWENGTSEDVTCLSRYQSNDTSIAEIDEAGLVTSADPGDTHVVISYDNAVVPIQIIRPASLELAHNYPPLEFNTEVDRLVLNKLRKVGVLPSDVCSDETFLRRASLDVTGTLPTAEEVIAFENDSRPDKRHAKIEELLSRPGYAAQWTTFLCDITGNNDDQLNNFMPQGVSPANQWYRWIYSRIQDNVPYDVLVEGIVTATSRKPDESYREYCEAMSEICRDATGEKFAERPGMVHYWARRNFQSSEDRVVGFAYAFLGVRIQCAQCHKHPFDQWAKSDFENFERLFTGVQANQNTRGSDAKRVMDEMLSELEIDKSLKGNLLRRELAKCLNEGGTVPLPELVLRNEPVRTKDKNTKTAKGAETRKAKLLGGEWVNLDQDDVRSKLMQWLRDPNNPYFAKAFVNRVWTQYFGVGIVNPADDLNLANAPSNAPLLDHLAAGFIASNYDMKWLHREILNSDTYQRSWLANDTNRLDKKNFSHALLRRLPAESTYDAVRMALASDEYALRAQELDIDRAITRSGASARAPGRDDESYALSVFGRSVRETNCDCDRSSEPSLLQTVFLINDTAVQSWLSDPRNSWVSSVGRKLQLGQTEPAVSKSTSAETPPAMQGFIKQIQRLDDRLDEAQAQGNETLVSQLQEKRSELRKRAMSVARKNGQQDQLRALMGETSSPDPESAAETTASAIGSQDLEWLIDQAYLRTLSRRPDNSEISLAKKYFEEEESPTAAIEGLMWSLVNTKEFILNH